VALLYIQNEVTKNAPFTGAAVDVSMVPGAPTANWNLVLEVLSSAANDGESRFVFADSTDGITFVDGPIIVVPGSNARRSPRQYTIVQRDYTDLRFGQSGSVLRLALTRLSGTSPSVVYRSWVTYS
jgi:hypothetical protein